MRQATIGLFLFLTVTLLSCSSETGQLEHATGKAESRAPGWQEFDLGPFHRPVSTRSEGAQLAFDQGLVWSYAFNHDEAALAFEEAARRDPSLAMAYWGIALVNGPHINNPYVEEAQARAAWEALGKAREHLDGASEVERALIEALGHRYAWPQPEDRGPLDRAYAAAMKPVYERFHEDADVATLYAESLLDLHPWDQWSQDGTPKEGTEEILAVLAHAKELDPNHLGALHLWIHSFESSSVPERATEAADILRALVPDASHLLHMPAHIDARLGKWADASRANEIAIAADARYLERDPKLGFYSLYMVHNIHFLAFTAMMEGRSSVAIERNDEIVRGLTPEKVREAPLFLEAFMTVGLDARKRFGRWDEILETPAPAGEFPIAKAYWHYSRGIAFAALGRLQEAALEREHFVETVPLVSRKAFWGSNMAIDVLSPALPYLDGEIAYARGDHDLAIAELSKAVRLEDGLKFDDPPPWTTPSRHALGAVLLEAGRYAQAEKVYRADLVRYPENGWSLHGLTKALSGQRKTKQAVAVEKQFREAWSRSDIPMQTSCLCVMPKKE